MFASFTSLASQVRDVIEEAVIEEIQDARGVEEDIQNYESDERHSEEEGLEAVDDKDGPVQEDVTHDYTGNEIPPVAKESKWRAVAGEEPGQEIGADTDANKTGLEKVTSKQSVASGGNELPVVKEPKWKTRVKEGSVRLSKRRSSKDPNESKGVENKSPVSPLLVNVSAPPGTNDLQADIDKFHIENRRLVEDRDNMFEQLNRERERVSNVLMDNSKVKDECKQLSLLVEDLRGRLSNHELEENNKSKTIKSLNEEIGALRETLSKERESSREEIKSLRIREDELEIAVQKANLFEKQHKDLEEEVSRLQKSASSKSFEAKKFEYELRQSSETQDDVLELKCHIGRLEETVRQLEDENQQHLGLIQRIREENGQIAAKDTELEELRLQIQLAEEKLEKDAALVEKLQGGEEAANRDDEVCHLNSELEKLKSNGHVLENENERLESEIEQLKEQNQRLEESIKSLRQELSSREADATDELHTVYQERLERQHAEFEDEKAVLERRLLESNRRLENMSISFDKLQESARATFESEAKLQEKCIEYENMIDDFQRQQSEQHRHTAAIDEERRMLKSQVANLQQEVSKLSQRQKQGVNALSGQLGEIERLREELQESLLREDSLKEEIKSRHGAQQQVHALSSELAATRGELKVAEADLERLTKERENLNIALGQLNHDRERRENIIEEKLKESKQRLDDEQKRAALEKAQLVEDKHSLEAKSQELAKEIRGLRQQIEVLLEERESSSKAQGENPAKVSADVCEEEEESGRSSKKSTLKQLVVSYFERKRSGTFEAQREMLTLLANMLEMTPEEKEVLGLVVLPKKKPSSRRVGQSEGTTNQNDETSEGVSLLSRILFGRPAQSEKQENPIDWKAMESAVTEKPFADL
eukprot:CAMPEP_0203744938 /NCGR_PEP_ID=MMETSP0098-20131031/838_1 /ASSEMBLY_ACC=CAM_ASM_000208 /TAXON_ID=96639 /ORGANISM=" , Strain NY0313808BC1" /LENGTH=884 /DNA_ID=CAMNT_0050632581 /DNA_START=470 /DNA_END=3121 /DNA_ORIENTATION=-